MIYPKRFQVETVFGCNASCVMCPVDEPTTRRKGVMDLEVFKRLIDQVAPYADQLTKTDLFGIGEPLLDRTICEKIAYAKLRGLPSVAISTNADLLDEERALRLLASGVDVVIFSIDGATAATHEAIRIGTHFDRVVANVERFVTLRDGQVSPTRIVFRFIRQDGNRGEWEAFRSRWLPRARLDRGDQVIAYDVQSWGGKIGIPKGTSLPQVPPELPCHHVWDRLIVLQDGTVPLCCADVHQPELDLGNAFQASPIEIYNGSKFEGIRELHRSGRRNEMRICRDCTILQSELAQQVIER